ncbi:MAG TPA: hypothetical protein PLD23_14450, partial [Armatimonadota bacterium]|nr:hypothetical protein [Armatimonadota bacterium]
PSGAPLCGPPEHPPGNRGGTEWKGPAKREGRHPAHGLPESQVTANGSTGTRSREPARWPEELRELSEALLQDPTTLGYRADLWALAPLAPLTKKHVAVRRSVTRVWRELQDMDLRPARRAV